MIHIKSTQFSLYQSSFSFFKLLRRVKKLATLRDLNNKLQKSSATNEINHEVNTLLLKHFPPHDSFLDDVKLIICFENYMKATLLSKGYLIHIITDTRKRKISALKKSQSKKRRPVKISDYVQLENPTFDSKLAKNTYLTLSDKTINFSHLLNNNYQKVIDLPAPILKILNEKNQRRNSLHFLTSYSTSLGPSLISETELLIQFINDTLVSDTNKLMANIPNLKHRLRLKPIKRKRTS